MVEPVGVRRTPAPAPVEHAFAHDALRERPLRGRPGFLHGRPRGRREPEQASGGQGQHADDDSAGGGDRQEIGLAGEEAPRGNEPHRNAPAEQGARPRHHPGVGRIEREDRFVRMVRIDSADGPPARRERFGERRLVADRFVGLDRIPQRPPLRFARPAARLVAVADEKRPLAVLFAAVPDAGLRRDDFARHLGPARRGGFPPPVRHALEQDDGEHGRRDEIDGDAETPRRRRPIEGLAQARPQRFSRRALHRGDSTTTARRKQSRLPASGPSPPRPSSRFAPALPTPSDFDSTVRDFD